ncbi:GDSL esterase/lipase, partial [Vitis vinifera]
AETTLSTTTTCAQLYKISPIYSSQLCLLSHLQVPKKSNVTYMYGLNLWLQRLYKLGARRVFVTGTGPMGCVPAEHAMRSKNRECAAELLQDQRRRFHGPFTWL